MAGTVYRKNQWRVQLAVPGVKLDTQSWDKATGGDISPSMAKHTPGGMGDEFPIGGRRSRNDIVLTRAWDDTLIGAYIALDRASGETPATVTLTPLRTAKVTAGKPITYTGVLGPVKRPDTDNESSDAGELEVTVSLGVAISGGGA